MADLEVVYLTTGQLKPCERNARVHSKAQIAQIATSITKFGFNSPIIVDEADMVLAGHGRLAAAKTLNLPTIPCIRLSSLTTEAKRAYRLADNKLADNSSFDWEIVASELKELTTLGYDVSVTGFGVVEIDNIISLDEDSSPKPSKDDRISDLKEPGEVVCRMGDIWRLGRHRLICGDARKPEDLGRLMNGGAAAMAFLDFPYNRSIVRDLSSRGAVRHGEFAIASGELSRSQFTQFLQEGLSAAVGILKDGAIVYGCTDWRHMLEMQMAGEAADATLLNMCVWRKTNPGQGQFYRSQHELIFVWKFGSAPHTNNFKLGETGRSRSNVWSYAGATSFGSNRLEELHAHPTPKPVDLVADAIKDVSRRGEIVLDSYAGAGSTLIAAQKTGRIARVMEIDPAYCDVIIKRFEALTGQLAVHDGSGRTFCDMQIVRGSKGWK